MSTTIKGIGYIRVSTRRQGRAWSLPGQRATIQEYAARVGIDLIAVYSDIETGTTPDRTQFSDALQRLRDGEASVLVICTLDRLDRNHPQILLLVDELQRLGIEIHLAKQARVMGRTADDRIADDREARLAEVERALFVERAADGRQAKIMRGHYPGGGQPPYGYRVEGRGPETQLVIDEEQAPIVRMIFQLFAYGDATGTVSAPEIARRLTALGLPTPGDLRKGFATTKKRAYGQWVAQSIYPLLRNSVYVGAFQQPTLFQKGRQTALSTHWEGCGACAGDCGRNNLARGAAAARHCASARPRPASPSVSGRQALEMRVRLPPDWPPERESARERTVFVVYVWWQEQQCAPVYDATAVRPGVDAVVWAWMKKVVANPDSRKAAHADHTAVQDARLSALDQERDQLYRQKVEQEQALSRLVDLYTRDNIPIELLDAKAAELRELLRVIQEAIERNERQRQTLESDDRSAALRAFAMEHQRRIADAEGDFAARRELVELLNVRVQVVLRGDEIWLHLTSLLGKGRKRLDLPPRKRR